MQTSVSRNQRCVQSLSHDVLIHLLYSVLLLLLQEWETKAGEARREYDKAKKEYKESGGVSTSVSKK